MSEMKFVLKCFAATLAVIFALQIHFKGQTLEDHSMTWVQNSSIGMQLQKVAEGAFQLGSKATNQAKKWLGHVAGNDEAKAAKEATNKAGSRLNMQWERSKEAIKNKSSELE